MSVRPLTTPARLDRRCRRRSGRCDKNSRRRGWGLVAASADPDERSRIQNALAFSCRGTWSNCNHQGILAVTRLLTDPDLAPRAREDRARLKGLLDDRVEVFNREATVAGLPAPRYEGGFFVSVFAEDAAGVAAAARGLAAATRWVRELRRETFALRQVTEEVTADILLSV